MYLTTEARKRFLVEAGRLGLQNPSLSVKTKNQTLKIVLKDGDLQVAQAYISHFPGCCGIAILHNASSAHQSLMFAIREEMAKQSQKGLLVYTGVDGDEPDFLREIGYRTASRRFFNPNSGNLVTTWTKRIGKVEDY